MTNDQRNNNRVRHAVTRVTRRVYAECFVSVKRNIIVNIVYAGIDEMLETEFAKFKDNPSSENYRNTMLVMLARQQVRQVNVETIERIGVTYPMEQWVKQLTTVHLPLQVAITKQDAEEFSLLSD